MCVIKMEWPPELLEMSKTSLAVNRYGRRGSHPLNSVVGIAPRRDIRRRSLIPGVDYCNGIGISVDKGKDATQCALAVYNQNRRPSAYSTGKTSTTCSITDSDEEITVLPAITCHRPRTSTVKSEGEDPYTRDHQIPYPRPLQFSRRVSLEEYPTFGEIEDYPIGSAAGLEEILEENSQSSETLNEVNGSIEALRRSDLLQIHSNKKEKKFNNTLSALFRTKNSNFLQEGAKRGRLFAKRKVTRLVNKNGDCLITNSNIHQKGCHYILDIFTTLLDMQWRYNFVIFVVAFLLSWLFFAALWWAIVLANEDKGDPDWKPCIENVDTFVTAFLFSIETQHTIGYGGRAITPFCSGSIILLSIQSVFGVIIQCVMAGVIFSKLSRSKKRAGTIMFSKNAVVCKRNGINCLMFRVADMRKSQIIGATLHAMLMKKTLTDEGEVLPFFQYRLELRTESEDEFVFLQWPITLLHEINEFSPFWNLSAEDLLTEQFEIIVFLEGIVEATGMTCQVRTSYLPSEILWGHRLSSLCFFDKYDNYHVNYSQFHATIPVPEMTEQSAKDVNENKYSNHGVQFTHIDHDQYKSGDITLV